MKRSVGFFGLILISALVDAQPAFVFNNLTTPCVNTIVVKAWKAGSTVEIAHGRSDQGSMRIPLPEETSPGLLSIELTGDCPLKNCEMVFSGHDLRLQLTKGEDGSPRLLADRETEYYWRANQIIDSLRQSLLELRKLIAVFSSDDTLGALLEQRHTQTQNRLNLLFTGFGKANDFATASSLLLARNFYVPDWRIPAGEQRKAILQNYFKLNDFHEPVFQHSPFFSQKLIDYLDVTSLSGEKNKDSALITGLDRFFSTVAPGDTLLRDIATVMRPWFLQNGFDATAEYLDIKYLSTQCTSDGDVVLKERLKAYHRTAKGQPAPEIFWVSNANEVRKLGDLPGNHVLVVFWATWCDHCMKTIPEIYKYTMQEGIPVVAIALDKTSVSWDKAIVAMPGWIHLRASAGWDDPWVKLYGVYGTPTIFVLDKDKLVAGKVSKMIDLVSLLH